MEDTLQNYDWIYIFNTFIRVLNTPPSTSLSTALSKGF